MDKLIVFDTIVAFVVVFVNNIESTNEFRLKQRVILIFHSCQVYHGCGEDDEKARGLDRGRKGTSPGIEKHIKTNVK